ncbi:MAG: hypothetical protein JST12_09690 [Armatimonadetes bacterium]|nr:hypothetical protein [Armatimonadota bacterium]
MKKRKRIYNEFVSEQWFRWMHRIGFALNTLMMFVAVVVAYRVIVCFDHLAGDYSGSSEVNFGIIMTLFLTPAVWKYWKQVRSI